MNYALPPSIIKALVAQLAEGELYNEEFSKAAKLLRECTIEQFEHLLESGQVFDAQ